MPVGVIYGAQSGIVRRVVADDNPETAQFDTHVGAGEALLVFEPKSNMLFEIVQEAEVEIAQLLGKKAIDSARCAVVDQDGTIKEFILADPLLDAHPDGELVTAYSEKIAPDAIYDKQTGLFTNPERVIPQAVDKRGNLVEETVIAQETVDKPATEAVVEEI